MLNSEEDAAVHVSCDAAGGISGIPASNFGVRCTVYGVYGVRNTIV
jgi:hypothetical protein